MTRLKLGLWDSVIVDCNACLSLAPTNMKAHFYLAQAQLSIGDFDSSLSSALRAYELCCEGNDRSLATVAGVVLRCKKDRWEARERRRRRQDLDLEDELTALLARKRDEMLAEEADDVERQSIVDEVEERIKRVRGVFERSRTNAEKRRDVPDWAIDDIGFGIMVDPVIVRICTHTHALSLSLSSPVACC